MDQDLRQFHKSNEEEKKDGVFKTFFYISLEVLKVSRNYLAQK